MVYSTYRFALLTFNLLCSIEAMKESFVGGDSVVDAYGAEDKGQKLQVSLGEHDTGHGETEDEANGEDVAFVEVTASGALTTIARPHNSSLVEAVQADEAELAGEAEQDEDAEETDEVDGAKLTGEAEKAKEAENDQPPDPLRAAAMAAHPMPTLCFPCIDKAPGYIFCKDKGKEQCWGSDSATGFADCMVYVKRDGQSAQVNVKTSVSSSLPVPPAGITTTVNVPSAIKFDDCGVLTGRGKAQKFVFCEEPKDNCNKKSCNAFCATAGKSKTTCENKKDLDDGKSGWVCGDKGQKLQLDDVKCHQDRAAAKKATCVKVVTAAAMKSPKSPQAKDVAAKGEASEYADCNTPGSECKKCIDQPLHVFCKD